ncbi:MAG: alkaline phosphatase family protein, partial [Planctomycetota bacterium]
MPPAIVLLLACAWLASAGEPQDPVHHAYIGPGAGIALLGSFLAVFSEFLSALFFVISWPIRLIWRGLRGRRPFARAKTKRV